MEIKTDIAHLVEIEQHLKAKIVEVTDDPKPFYVVADEKIPWIIHLKRLRSMVEWCEWKLAEPRELLNATGN